MKTNVAHHLVDVGGPASADDLVHITQISGIDDNGNGHRRGRSKKR